jgi:hypothetical protein
MSIDLLLSASLFAREAHDLEQAIPSPSGQAAWDVAFRRHRSFVIASVLTSASFQEAVINEVIRSAGQSNLEVADRLSEVDRRRLIDLAEDLDRMSTLGRYQLVLHLLNREPFDRGAQPFQDADLLVALRNALVHYKPEWRPGANSPPSTIGLDKRLESRRFALNQFFPVANPFFPDRCLGHGCCAWALGAALRLADEFHRRLGVHPIYEGFRDQLDPGP